MDSVAQRLSAVGAGAALELRGVTRLFGALAALTDVTITVRPGERRAVLGSNGAGKTTLFNTISGFLPYTGEILRGGEKLRGTGPAKIARSGLVQCPESRELFGEMTVRENLDLGGQHLDDAARAKQLAWLFELFPILKERQGQMAQTLSGGEQQMLAIARALVRDPKIILLDEPFEGLAPVIVRDLMKACRDLAEAGQTIVLVEQNLAATLALAQRIYIINNGHIVHEGPAQEIKAQPDVLQRYLGV